MDKSAVAAIARAIAVANGHSHPDDYAAAVAEAYVAPDDVAEARSELELERNQEEGA